MHNIIYTLFKFYGDLLSPQSFIYFNMLPNYMKDKKELEISVLELNTMEDFEDK